MKIIAESAFNHNGSFDELKKLALLSKESGADFFTAQIMNVDAFCVKDYKRYDIYKSTEFTEEQWIELFNYCKDINIDFIPCVLDEKSFELVVAYGYKLIKIHATDITNEPFLRKISQHDVRVLLETQCATLFEVNFAIDILGNDKIESLFSGYSNYPSEVEEFNLNVLDTFKKEFSFNLGYADHSLDTQAIPLMILAKGCKYIEKHITSTRNNRNYDWQVSLYPQEFSNMVNSLKHYKKALGNGVKHPSENEKSFRSVMYKKIIDSNKTLKRADEGEYYIENLIDSFDNNNIIVALIARLKSNRLKKKVLLEFHNEELIVDLYNRINNAKSVKRVVLATSDLEEDNPLVDLFVRKGYPVFRGHAISVIDRMLKLAINEKASAIFRVTGDNPFTDPDLMDEMARLLKKHELEYVKVNNAPFGIGAELFSTKYLWKLYLKLNNPMLSEYLSWYVLKDMDVKMGSVDINYKNNMELINLSVDYHEDYIRCLKLIKQIDKKEFSDINLKDIFINCEGLDKVDGNKTIKLPNNNTINLYTYLDSFKSKECEVRKNYFIK